MRLASLDGGRGRSRRCCGREALRDKEGEGTRCQETKHSVGENVRIVRFSALDGGRGLHHRCCGRESLRDKEGEGTRCQETKHSVGENVRIVRLEYGNVGTVGVTLIGVQVPQI